MDRTRLPAVSQALDQVFHKRKVPDIICRSCAALSARITELRSELMVAKVEAQQLKQRNQALQAEIEAAQSRQSRRSDKGKRVAA